MNSSVTLERGQPHQRGALEQLAQLYVHDFTEFLGPEHDLTLGEDGRFGELPHLDEYWTAPDRAVWFIRVDGKLAGFALLSAYAHSGLPVDYNVGEYFVARPYRRGGVGARAFAQLLAHHRGQWELAIGARNAPAQAFWPRAVAAAANVANLETLAGDGVSWTGPILRFSVA